MVLLSPSPDSSCRGAKQPSDLPHVYEEIGYQLAFKSVHWAQIMVKEKVV